MFTEKVTKGGWGNGKNCRKIKEQAQFCYKEEHYYYKKYDYYNRKRKKIGGRATESSGVDVQFSPIYNLNFNFDFNVREYFANYQDLFFAAVHNCQHYLNEHMFKPRKILQEEGTKESCPVKSIFF